MPSVVRFGGGRGVETSSCCQLRNIRLTILLGRRAGYSAQGGIDDFLCRSFGGNLGARRLSQVVREGTARSGKRFDLGPDRGAARVGPWKLRVSGDRSNVPH